MKLSFLAYGAGMIACLAFAAKSTTLEQRVYVQKCTGGWYVANQGTDGESDWVDLKCNDSDND